MGCGASAQPVAPAPNTAPAKRASPPQQNPTHAAPPKPIDVSVLEERRADLQRQIDAMERQLAATRVAADQEAARHAQLKSQTQLAEQQQRQAAAAAAAAAAQSDNTTDPARSSPAARSQPTPQQQQQPQPRTPGATPPLPRTVSATPPAGVAPSPGKGPVRLNPLRQGSGSGPMLAPLDTTQRVPPPSQQSPGTNGAQIARTKTDKSDAGENGKRKTLKQSQSSKQDQMDLMRAAASGGSTSSGAAGQQQKGLARTGTGHSFTNAGSGNNAASSSSSGGGAAPAGQPSPGSRGSVSSSAELKANLAARGKSTQALSNNKGATGNYLNRVPVSKLRALNADDLREIWDHYDADGNGYLDRQEITKLATECVERTLKMFADQMKAANPDISDADLKKEVDRERFFLLPGSGNGKTDQTQDMIRMLVQKLDINRDGQVSRAELMMQWNSFSSDLFKTRTAEGSLDCSIM